uniref:Uncharacterized protein n=1 Tax=Rhizophora mucronata TaxID=61149 RepID=A0A2P2QDN1_RHIMU
MGYAINIPCPELDGLYK